MSGTAGARPRRRIAEVASEIMRSAEADTVSFGDGMLDDIAEAAGIEARDYAARWTRVLDGLERAPDLFEKSLGWGFDSRGLSRQVRVFKLRP